MGFLSPHRVTSRHCQHRWLRWRRAIYALHPQLCLRHVWTDAAQENVIITNSLEGNSAAGGKFGREMQRTLSAWLSAGGMLAPPVPRSRIISAALSEASWGATGEREEKESSSGCGALCGGRRRAATKQNAGVSEG